jgi:hypothetical protein
MVDSSQKSRSREEWVRSVRRDKDESSTLFPSLGSYALKYRITPATDGKEVDKLHLAGKEAQLYAFGLLVGIVAASYGTGVYLGSEAVGQQRHPRVRSHLACAAGLWSTSLLSWYLVCRYDVGLS